MKGWSKYVFIEDNFVNSDYVDMKEAVEVNNLSNNMGPEYEYIPVCYFPIGSLCAHVDPRASILASEDS